MLIQSCSLRSVFSRRVASICWGVMRLFIEPWSVARRFDTSLVLIVSNAVERGAVGFSVRVLSVGSSDPRN